MTFAGRSAYRFSLPVQRLADAARVAQVVTVDARTLLPERIEWRVRGTDGPARTVAVIDIAHVDGGRARPRAAGRVHAPARAAARRSPSSPRPGGRCGSSATRRLTLAQARALRPRIDWLGPRVRAATRLDAITLYRYNAGVAVRLRYGRAAACGTTGRSCRRALLARPARAGQADPGRPAHGPAVRDRRAARSPSRSTAAAAPPS